MKIIYIIALSLILAVSGYYGKNVPFSEQWPMYEALRTTAAIIFAVVGAWIAIKFPDRKKTILNEDNVAINNGFGHFFTPAFHSMIILISVLAIGITAPVIKQIVFFQKHYEFLRGLSYFTLTALTIFQIWTVIISLLPAAELKYEVDTENAISKRQHNRKRQGSFASDE